MFKLLYKTLLISTLSGTLSLLSFQALAQDAGGIGKDASGNLVQTQAVKLEAAKQDDMMASITMLAIGAIAGRMAVNYRPMTTDAMVAAAGGIAYIAGELMSNIGFKKTMDEMALEIQKTSAATKDEEQIQRLVDLKKSYEEARKSTNTKKTLQLASAAAFGVAAGIAAYMVYQEHALAAACQASLVTVKATLTTCAAATAGTPLASEALACGACQLELATFSADMMKIEAMRVSPGTSLGKKSAVTPTQTAGLLPKCVSTSEVAQGAGKTIGHTCGAALKSEMLNQIFSYEPKTVINDNTLRNNYLFTPDTNFKALSPLALLTSQLSNLFFPQAEASWIPLLGFGGAAAASFLLITGPLATTVDMQMFVPLNRAIAFGLLGGMAYLSSKSSQSQLDKIDENIKKIDKILDELNRTQKGIQTATVTAQRLATTPLTLNRDTAATITTSVPTDCAASSGNTNCKTLSSQISSMTGFSNLPDAFKDIAIQTSSMGDALSGKTSLSSGGLSDAATLAGKQNAIANLLKKTQTKLNNQLALMGKPKIDFDNEQSKLLKNLNSTTKKALNGQSPSNFLSSLGSTPISGTSEILKSSEVYNKKIPVTGFGSSSGSASGSNKDLTLDFKEPASSVVASGATGKEAKYDIGTNDITTDQGISIFEVISNRYIKSGYPKLLEEIPVKK